MAKCFDVVGYVEPCNAVRQKYTGRALLITGVASVNITPDIQDNIIPNEVPEDKDVIKNAYLAALNNVLNATWDIISELNSVIATSEVANDCPNKEDVKNILNTIVDDTTITIGMLNKAIELVNPKFGELINQGENKAEDSIESDVE